MAAITDYHRDIRITANSIAYNFKIDRMRVWASIYNGGNPVASELYDGSFQQRHLGWRLHCVLDWDEMVDSDHDSLDSMINSALTGGDVTIDFDYVNDLGVKVGTFVLEDVDDALALIYEGGVKARSASLSFIGKEIQAAPPTWITQA